MTILDAMRSHVIRHGVPIAAIFWLTLAGSGATEQRRLTLEDVYGSSDRGALAGRRAPTIRWIDGTHYAMADARPTFGWKKVDAASGATAPLFEASGLETALSRVPGVADSRTLTFNASYTAAVLRVDDDLYFYSFADQRLTRLTSAPGPEELPSFSPDGRLVAYLRANNLYVADVSTGRETALTTDGAAKILNGRLDWVYEEEIYGRGQKRAFWWSPDSSQLAFLRLDDGPVPTFPVVDHIPYEQQVEQWDYPKAGDPNPLVTLGIAHVGGGATTWVDTSRYPPADCLIVRVGWTPDGSKVVYEAQNRTQTWLDLDVADRASGASQLIMRETGKYWIAADDAALPLWLKDGSFLWLSDRSGWRHLYHYKHDGTVIRQVTGGKWEFRTLHGIDESSGLVYFSGTERSPLAEDVYRVKLDGTGLRRLSERAGAHAADFSPSFGFYVDSSSDITTPRQTRLHTRDGGAVRVLDDETLPALANYELSKPEFVQVKTRDGFVMEAMMIKPPYFDPARRYPVYQFTYGGPHAPQVRNAWGGTQYLYHQLLAQRGIIVWICDNRTASGKGSESEWPLYRNFGEIELRDIEDGLNWLKQQRYVDASRIGIHGWSYGGYMTSYALTHSKSFVMGIAGGTVADWRDYDSVYTERYMGLPAENPEGYRKSSPRFAAADLHGALMLIHGTIDDNVHVANTMQLAYELQKAQKPFQLMLYPKSRHGVVDPALVRHMRTAMLDFVLEQLKPETVANRATSSR
jgi:dipeptidyl-peptidase 4